MSQVSGLQKQISALRGQRRELLGYLREHGTLADKARLIHQGIWKCPTFDEDTGLVRSTGWEGDDYSPSRVVLDPGKGVEQWRHIESSDPVLIEQAISLWGIDAVCAEFQHYGFEFGDFKKQPIYRLINGQYEIVGYED